MSSYPGNQYYLQVYGRVCYSAVNIVPVNDKLIYKRPCVKS